MPALPRTILNYPRPTPRNIKRVRASDNLQTALDGLRGGDWLELEAGATWVGNFVLPSNTSNEWIQISGGPIKTGRATKQEGFARILTPNNDGALKTRPDSSRIYLSDLEIAVETSRQNGGILLLGTSDQVQNSLAVTPFDIVVNRCYIHGHPQGDVSRGIALNSRATAIVDSYISEIHGYGFDTQAICGWNGPGPFKIVNNYLEASGENVMFGGALAYIPGLVPSDIEFRLNGCSRPLSWNQNDPANFAGKRWSVKNIFELKNAQYVLVEGNVFENHWVDAQAGPSIVFTPRGEGGRMPHARVQDVTFRHNIIRNVAAGLAILAADDLGASLKTERILIENNLWEGVGAANLGANGRLFQIVGDSALSIHFKHNTAFHQKQFLVFDGTPHRDIQIVDNLSAGPGEYGIFGSGQGEGLANLNYYAPQGIVKRNLLTGRTARLYPPDNFFPATTAEIGFINLGAKDYRLDTTSQFKGKASDGKDIGVDIAALQAAMQQGVTPTPPPPPPSATVRIEASFDVPASDAERIKAILNGIEWVVK